MKIKAVIEAISWILIIIFLYAALSKLFIFQFFREDLHQSPILKNYATFLSIALPVSELVTAILLFIPSKKKFGFYLSTLLMLSFTFYVGYMLKFMSFLPCQCGGIFRMMSWPMHLYFNIALTLLSILALILLGKQTKSERANKNLSLTGI